MKAAFPPSAGHGDWKTLYRAAILETNKNVVPRKVSEAELAVLARGRELFYGGGTGDEKESLEDALYLLRAYKKACEYAEMDITGTAATAA